MNNNQYLNHELLFCCHICIFAIVIVLPINTIKFFNLFQCVFLVWCFVPANWNGSDVIYSRIIRPVFMKHQNRIDSTMNKVSDRLIDLADNASKAMKDD